MLTKVIYNQSEHAEMVKAAEKRRQYFSYIQEHINNVKDMYKKFFENLDKLEYHSDKIHYDDLIVAINNCKSIIDEHDVSKYYDEEFEAYRVKFYPTDYERVRYTEDEMYRSLVDEAFEEAWVHHYTNNSHHPLYWKESTSNNIKDMTLEAIIEMICDWEAMSFKFGTDTIEWYKNQADKEKSQMSEKTRELVEEILFNIIH